MVHVVDRASPSILSTLKCAHCGAPLSPHRFGLTARCVYCQTTSLIDTAGVDANLIEETRHRYARQVNAWPYEIIERGDHLWHPLGTRFTTSTFSVGLAESVAWPSERTLLVRSLSPAGAQALAGTKGILNSLSILSSQQNVARYPFLPTVADAKSTTSAKQDEGELQFIAFRTAFGHQFPFSEIIRAYDRLPGPACIWTLARLLELAAWLHQLGWTLGDCSPHDLVFPSDEHSVTVFSFAKAQNVATADRVALDISHIVRCVEQMHVGIAERPLKPDPSDSALAEFLRNLHSGPKNAALPLADKVKSWGRDTFGKSYFPLSRLASY